MEKETEAWGTESNDCWWLKLVGRGCAVVPAAPTVGVKLKSPVLINIANTDRNTRYLDSHQ